MKATETNLLEAETVWNGRSLYPDAGAATLA